MVTSRDMLTGERARRQRVDQLLEVRLHALRLVGDDLVEQAGLPDRLDVVRGGEWRCGGRRRPGARTGTRRAPRCARCRRPAGSGPGVFSRVKVSQASVDCLRMMRGRSVVMPVAADGRVRSTAGRPARESGAGVMDDPSWGSGADGSGDERDDAQRRRPSRRRSSSAARRPRRRSRAARSRCATFSRPGRSPPSTTWCTMKSCDGP